MPMERIEVSKVWGQSQCDESIAFTLEVFRHSSFKCMCERYIYGRNIHFNAVASSLTRL